MDIALIVLSLLVLLILTANRLAGSESNLGGRWIAASERQEAAYQSEPSGPKPVTKRYLQSQIALRTALLAAVALLSIISGDKPLRTLMFCSVLGALYSVTIVRLYREYRKPGHGARRQPHPATPPDDDW